VPVAPDSSNGLRSPCSLMVDKITTVSRGKLGVRVGRLDDETMLRLNRSVFVFLGLAAPSRKG
jgi:mRNA interferase MazF